MYTAKKIYAESWQACSQYVIIHSEHWHQNDFYRAEFYFLIIMLYE
jgi:hypothetical protein